MVGGGGAGGLVGAYLISRRRPSSRTRFRRGFRDGFSVLGARRRRPASTRLRLSRRGGGRLARLARRPCPLKPRLSILGTGICTRCPQLGSLDAGTGEVIPECWLTISDAGIPELVIVAHDLDAHCDLVLPSSRRAAGATFRRPTSEAAELRRGGHRLERRRTDPSWTRWPGRWPCLATDPHQSCSRRCVWRRHIGVIGRRGLCDCSTVSSPSACSRLDCLGVARSPRPYSPHLVSMAAPD
jgi:hypothetical protein